MARTYNHYYQNNFNDDYTFEVVRQLKVNSITITGLTDHAKKDRNKRIEAMKVYFKGGRSLTAFEVKRDHDKGNEYHIIYDNGVVVIVNVNDFKLITTFVHSVWGICQYWKGRPASRHLEYLKSVCRKNYPTYIEYCKDADKTTK